MNTKTSIILIFIIIQNILSTGIINGIPEVQFCEYNPEQIEIIKDKIYVETITPNGVKIMGDRKKPIGSGSFGKVYDLGEGKALKLIKLFHYKLNELTNELKVHDLFKYEVTSLSHLESCFYYKSTDRKIHFFLIMDYYKTGSLFKMIDTTMSESLIWKFDNMYKITKDLKKMHDKGYAHLDIKMENIFYMNIYTPILGDFGLSLDINNGETHSKMVGTRPYAAPETYLNNYDLKTDIYALGVLFYEILNSVIAEETENLPDIDIKVDSTEIYKIYQPLIKDMVRIDNRPDIDNVMSRLLNNLNKVVNILNEHSSEAKVMQFIPLEKYLIYEKNTVKKETENQVVVRYKDLLAKELKEREQIYKKYKIIQTQMIFDENELDQTTDSSINEKKENNLNKTVDPISQISIEDSTNKIVTSVNNLIKDSVDEIDVLNNKIFNQENNSINLKAETVIEDKTKISNKIMDEINLIKPQVEKKINNENINEASNSINIKFESNIQNNNKINNEIDKNLKTPLITDENKNLKEDKNINDVRKKIEIIKPLENIDINKPKEDIILPSIIKNNNVSLIKKNFEEGLKIDIPQKENETNNLVNLQIEKLENTPLINNIVKIEENEKDKVFIKIDEEPLEKTDQISPLVEEIKKPLIEQTQKLLSKNKVEKILKNELEFKEKITENKKNEELPNKIKEEELKLKLKEKLEKNQLKFNKTLNPINLPKLNSNKNDDIMNKTEINVLNENNNISKNQMIKPRKKLSTNKLNIGSERNREFLLSSKGLIKKEIKSKLLESKKNLEIQKINEKNMKNLSSIKKKDFNIGKTDLISQKKNKDVGKKLVSKKFDGTQSLRNNKVDINSIIGPSLDLSSIISKKGEKKNYLLINKLKLENLQKKKNFGKSEIYLI